MKTCKHCGSSSLAWYTAIVNRSGIQQGRLNTSDVECMFFLGCEECIETLVQVGADRVAEKLNMMGVR